MSLAKISVALLAPLAALASDSDQCVVEERRTYTNCWGHDLSQYDGPAKSFEECCQGCLDIPECKVFTYDKYNASGEEEWYCFFKSDCTEPRHSDSAMSGIAPHTGTTSTTTTTTKSTTTTTTTTITTTTMTTSTTTTTTTTVSNTTTTTTTTTQSTTKPTPPPQTTATTTATTTTTTTAEPNLPKCAEPEEVPGVGLAEAVPINVSSHDDCCHLCTLDEDDDGSPTSAPCTYVTFGDYMNSSGVACFLHRFKNETNTSKAVTAFLNLVPRVVRRLLHSRGAKSCADFGLTNCLGALVVPPVVPGIPVGWLALAGIVSFAFALTLGFGFSRRYKLSSKLLKGHNLGLGHDQAAEARGPRTSTGFSAEGACS